MCDLPDKRIVLFSYGSGLASSMFSLRVSNNTHSDLTLAQLKQNVDAATLRLSERNKLDPDTFAKVMKLREDTHHLGRAETVNLYLVKCKISVCEYSKTTSQ